jgi:hypothetical protein
MEKSKTSMRTFINCVILLLAVSAPALPSTQGEERRFLDPQKVPAEGPSEASFVPAGWRVEQTYRGDLNGDRLADAALKLIEDLPHETNGVWTTRHRALVVIFRRASGGFARAAVATRLLYCSTCAGALADPAGGNVSVEIKNGVLNVAQLSGSREATEHVWRFRHDARAGRFVLIGEDVDDYDRAVGDSTRVSTNYLTGVRVTKVFKVKRAGREPVLVSNKRARIQLPRRFLEDIDYEE